MTSRSPSTASPRALRRLAGGALLAFALATLGTGCPRKPKAPAVADLVRATGSVQLHRDQKEQPAMPAPLFAGDLLVTGPASSAVVRFAGGAEIEVSESSRFLVDGSPVAVSLDLSAGSIVFRGGGAGTGAGGAGRGAGASLQLLTPFGISRLPADSAGRLDVQDGQLTLEVTTGTITFISQDGKEQRAEQGQQLQVKLGEIQLVRNGQVETPDAGQPQASAVADAGSDADAGQVATPTITLAPIEVTLEARGTVQVRAAGEKKFRRAGRSGAIAAGTEFVVPQSGSARISTPGMSVELSGGARGKLGGATRSGEAERLELSLPAGKARLVLSAGEHEVVLAGAKGELVLRSREESTVELRQGARDAALEVQAGGVEVVFRGESRSVAAGESVKIADTIGEETQRQAAGLVLHASPRITVYAPARDPVTLTWPKTAGPVQLQVARDAEFADLLISGKISGSSSRLPPSGAQRLFWRVRDLEGKLLYGGQLRFAQESKRSSGHSPHNDVHQTGQKAVVYYQSALPSLSLVFPRIEGAQKYGVQVFQAANLAKPVIDRTVTTERCDLKAGELGEGSYLWSVTPVGGRAPAGGSLMNKLEIVFDNAIAELIIEKPSPGEKAGRTVAIQGVAPLGSRLLVHDKPVPLDARGRFSAEVPAAPMLVFRLIRGDSESYWIRSLRTR